MNLIEQKALEIARHSLEYSHSPYSNLKVAAALVAADESIFSGVNVENASYGLTICAERAALVKAVSEGVRAFQLLVITTSGNKPVFPCGACLQVLAEFCDDLEIISVDSSGKRSRAHLNELLPRRFML